jgi:hypothetical protein
MADLAAVFHWRPSDMDHMDPGELMEWRERARVRFEPKPNTRLKS